jgi:ATP-binding cassette subfamily C protein
MPKLMTNKNTDRLSGRTACGRGLVAAGGFSLALNLLMPTVPLYMMSVYDRVLASRSEETLLLLSLVAIGALAAIGILDAVRQLVLTWAGLRLETGLWGSSPARITAEQPGVCDRHSEPA